MLLSLVRGQKIDLTKNNQDLNMVHIGLDWKAPSHFDIDVSAFLVGANDKIIREEDFVFYGQPNSSNNSVSLEESISSIEKQHFIIDLLNVPSDVQKIAFTLTIYDCEKAGLTFQDVTDIQLRVVDSRIQEEIASFQLNYSFTKESAIVLGSLYRYSGEWKFHAVGAGFNGGLADLCNEYGVEVDEQPNEIQQGTVQPCPDSTSPNDRFHIVQRPDETINIVEIPKPPTEMIQLKRPDVVQFNDDRIATLSQQSDELIQLFNEQEPATNRISIESTIPTPTFLDESKEDYESFIDSLDEMETNFFLLSEIGTIPLEKAKTFVKDKGQMIALFINTINEKANIHLGDNLLELQSEAVVVFDEFEPLVAKIKERVRNEY